MPHSSRTARFLFSAVFVFVGAIFLFIGGTNFLDEARYQQQGVRAQAVTTAKTLRRATADTATSYEISYRFSAAQGNPEEQTESVPVHLWESVEEGSPLTIEYVPGQPGSARAVRDSPEGRVVATVMLGIGAVLLIIGLAVLKGALLPGAHGRPTGPAQENESQNPMPEAVSHAGSFWPFARRSFGFWFGGIFLLCGLPFFVTSIFLLHGDWRFAQEAQSTQGMVLTKEIRVSRSHGRRSRSTRTRHFEATYRFTVEGETFEGRDELSHDGWQQLVEREPVEVLYLPPKPESNRLAGHSGWLLNTMLGLVGSVLTAVGGVIFVRAVRKARLESRLRQHGVRTQGIVTELQERNVKINDVQQWRLHYEYSDFQGIRHPGTIDLPEDEAQGWKVGDAGAVLYDPSRPTEAVWLGRETGVS